MEVPRDRHGRPRVYLEEDCPIEEIGIECQREGSVGLHPPVNRLHVWWARRPLTVSGAAVIGSVLPSTFPREGLLQLLGISGDPIKARARIADIRAGLEKDPGGDLYGYKRAFSNPVSQKHLQNMRESIRATWNTGDVIVLDSFAGGGSIPFETVRMGLKAVSNELNPVACVIERATIEYPMVFGKDLAKDIERIGEELATEIEKDLADCFPKLEGEVELDYIWVRTVKCKKCGLDIPLSPNWRLDAANRVVFRQEVPSDPSATRCVFHVEKQKEGFDSEDGSVVRANAKCPRCPGVILDGDELKREARAGRMDSQLAAVLSFRMMGRKKVRIFREVGENDLEGVAKAEELLEKKLPEWEARGLVPDEEIPEGNKTRELRNSGVMRWCDMFSSRQLLVHLTTLDHILNYPWDSIKDPKRREALRVYMQMVFDKTISHDSRQSRYDPGNNKVCNAFERHDFAFRWSFAEIDGAGNLFRFGYSQVADAYKGLASLLAGADGKCEFLTQDARSLASLESGSIHAAVIDPPYYDNVMYSELSDFFYVWMKRGLSDIFPDLFHSELTNKDDEAVANVFRFKSNDRGKARGLAHEDYEKKMKLAFQEIRRVLKDDGVMTVMFTHKQVEAWDALARALLDGGFEITSSWPVHTEGEHSLHQAKKNAAASTILLVCRKRPRGAKTAWWEEIQQEIDKTVKEKAKDFSARGLRGQDVFIACFGPALEVISESWPVKKKDGTIVSPDKALDRARTIVSEWFFEKIAEGKAEALDPRTRFYILAWHVFHAREFRFDEARKLGISLNVEVEDLIRAKILKKKGDYVVILKPEERFREKGLRPDAKSYDYTLDFVQAAMHAYSSGKSAELNRFHQRTGALVYPGYKETIGYLLDVLPRTEEVVEYAVLNEMWESNYREQVKRKIAKTDPTGKLQTKLDIDQGHP
jgi:adenine-specific DNA methylase